MEELARITRENLRRGPAALRDLVVNGEARQRAATIASRYALDDFDATSLKNAAILVLANVLPLNHLPQHLVNVLDASPDMARTLAEELDLAIFARVKPQLDAFLAPPPGEQGKIVLPPPPPPPPEARRAAVAAPSMPASRGPASPSSAPTPRPAPPTPPAPVPPASILRAMTPPPAPVAPRQIPPPINAPAPEETDFIAAKLTMPTFEKAEEHASGAPQASPARKSYPIDPYREPVE